MHCATCMQHFTNVEKATTQYKPEIDEGKIKNHKNLSNENGGYFMHGDLLKNEIQLAKDECCVIFDFGCYFPYKNTEDLTFDFSLGGKQFHDKKLNHRYPNTGYQTISRKYGRKVSKLGYPYVMKLDEQDIMLLKIKVGLCENTNTLIFPIQTYMTQDRPACVLSMNYIFDEMKVRFMSHDSKDGGWHQHNWYNYMPAELIGENESVITGKMEGKRIIYHDVIKPFPSSKDNLLI